MMQQAKDTDDLQAQVFRQLGIGHDLALAAQITAHSRQSSLNIIAV